MNDEDIVVSPMNGVEMRHILKCMRMYEVASVAKLRGENVEEAVRGSFPMKDAAWREFRAAWVEKLATEKKDADKLHVQRMGAVLDRLTSKNITLPPNLTGMAYMGDGSKEQRTRWIEMHNNIPDFQEMIKCAALKDDVERVKRLQLGIVDSALAKGLATLRVTNLSTLGRIPGLDEQAAIPPDQVDQLDVSKNYSQQKYFYTDGAMKVGVPTLKARAQQELVRLALEPQIDAELQEEMYGVGERTFHAAIREVKRLSKKRPDAHVLRIKLHIKDVGLPLINAHAQIMNRLDVILTAGTVERYQGGIATRENVIADTCAVSMTLGAEANPLRRCLVALNLNGVLGCLDAFVGLQGLCYGNEILLMHDDADVLTGDVQKWVEQWLEENTRYTINKVESKLNSGRFDFLDHTFRRGDADVKVAPSKAATKELLRYYEGKLSKSTNWRMLEHWIYQFQEADTSRAMLRITQAFKQACPKIHLPHCGVL